MRKRHSVFSIMLAVIMILASCSSSKTGIVPDLGGAKSESPAKISETPAPKKEESKSDEVKPDVVVTADKSGDVSASEVKAEPKANTTDGFVSDFRPGEENTMSDLTRISNHMGTEWLYVRRQGNWLYYVALSKNTYDYNIYKMPVDNSSADNVVFLRSAEDVTNFQVIGDWLYWYNKDNDDICRMRTDGSLYTTDIAKGVEGIGYNLLFKMVDSGPFVIVDDCIYFTAYREKQIDASTKDVTSCLMRMKLDGTSVEEVYGYADSDVTHFDIKGFHETGTFFIDESSKDKNDKTSRITILYNIYSEKSIGIYRWGRERYTYSQISHMTFDEYSNKIYAYMSKNGAPDELVYINANDSEEFEWLYDYSRIVPLAEGASYYYAVVKENAVYYSESSGLYKASINTDTYTLSNIEKLNNDKAEYMCIIDDYIYYYCNADSKSIYFRVKTDGSAWEPIDWMFTEQ